MKRSVHVATITRAQLAAIRRQNEGRAGPGSVLHKLKPKVKRGEPEHDAQVRLFELLDGETVPLVISAYRSIIHAVPQYVGVSVPLAKRYKAEGQRAGMPDVHVPVPSMASAWSKRYASPIASLYVELKVGAYPSEDQRRVFRMLANAGNAVIVVKNPDVETLAGNAFNAIVRYLDGRSDFIEHAHPKFIYLPD